MNKFLLVLATVALLFGCSNTNTEEGYVGTWSQVNHAGTAPMTAAISKVDDGYVVAISLPLSSQPALKGRGRFENGTLKVEGLEPITLNRNTGHLMIGVNEFELKQP